MPVAIVEQVGRAIVIVHPAGSMPREEWTANVAKMRALTEGAEEVRVIVWADGVIDTYQRKEVLDLMKKRASTTPAAPVRKGARVRVVMFTSSMLTRGVMQALSWMGVNVGSYTKNAFAKDIAAEGFTPREVTQLESAIAAMEQRIRAS